MSVVPAAVIEAVRAIVEPLRAAGRPGWLPDSGVMARLREMRRLRRQARALYDGRYREVLVDAGRSQFYFRSILRGGAGKGPEAAALVARVDVVPLAIRMHAAILLGRGPRVVAIDDAQQAAVTAMLDRSGWDQILTEMAVSVVRDGYAVLRTSITRQDDPLTGMEIDAATLSMVHSGGDSELYPMGPVGPDGQPPAIERRWLIERPDPRDPRKTATYLRVERHRSVRGLSVAGAPGWSVVGVIEQECYRTDSADDLVDLSTAANDDKAPLRRVPLSLVGVTAQDITVLGTSRPLMVMVSRRTEDGWPAMLVRDQTLVAIDQQAASLSQVMRAAAIHLSPRLRVPEAAVDRKAGVVNTEWEAIYDPNKITEYITSSIELEAGLGLFERTLECAMTELMMPPSLVGLRLNESAQPRTYESRYIEASMALLEAQATAQTARPALSLLVTLGLRVESELPGRMYGAGTVAVTLTPELPRAMIERAREQVEMVAGGVTSRAAALREIHGDKAAEAVLAEIEGEQQAESDRQRSAAFGAVGMTDPSLNSDDALDPVETGAGGDGGGA